MFFPEAKFTSNTIEQQIKHLVTEYEEILLEFTHPPVDYEKVTIEIYDLIHSAETGVRIVTGDRLAFYEAFMYAPEGHNPAWSIQEQVTHIDQAIVNLLALQNRSVPAILALLRQVIREGLTALQILENQKGIDIEEARIIVLAKNSARHYYLT